MPTVQPGSSVKGLQLIHLALRPRSNSRHLPHRLVRSRSFSEEVRMRVEQISLVQRRLPQWHFMQQLRLPLHRASNHHSMLVRLPFLRASNHHSMRVRQRWPLRASHHHSTPRLHRSRLLRANRHHSMRPMQERTRSLSCSEEATMMVQQTFSVQVQRHPSRLLRPSRNQIRSQSFLEEQATTAAEQGLLHQLLHRS